MKAILFDLDGVLVHSFEFWLSLMNHCADVSGHPRVSREALSASWGQSPDEDAAEFFPDWEAQEISRFYDYHAASHADLIQPGKTMVNAVQNIRSAGIGVGVVTNSSYHFATLALNECRLNLDILVTADDVSNPKPHPEGLYKACAAFSSKPQAIVLVGDSEYDQEAAMAAGVRFVDVTSAEVQTLAERGESATAPHWDLADLRTLPDGTRVGPGELLSSAEQLTETLLESRKTVSAATADEIAEFMQSRGKIEDLLGRARAIGELTWSAAVTDSSTRTLRDGIESRASAVESTISFFDKEWCALSNEHAAAVMAHSAIAGHCQERLRRIRDQSEGRLCTEAERVLLESDLTGVAAWRELHHQLRSRAYVEVDGNLVGIDAALDELRSPDRSRRKSITERISTRLATDIDSRAFVFETVARDHSTKDRLRGRTHWLAARTRVDGVSLRAVDALARAVDTRYDLARRWYQLKAEILGVDRLTDFDRQAPIGEFPSSLDWTEARAIMSSAYHQFDSRLGAASDRFFDEAWIDAAPDPTKRSGAFCWFTVPSTHPYIQLSWHGSDEDLLTLAHELGHGIHGLLARKVGIHHQVVSEALAEAVAQVAETIVLRHRIATARTKRELLTASARLLDRSVSVVFRLRAFWQFEQDVHMRVREGIRLDSDQLGDMWSGRMAQLFGDTVELSPGHRHWWSEVPHFIEAPGYLYNYIWGQLLATTIYSRCADSSRTLVNLMEAGGSAPQEELLRSLGIDLESPRSWHEGLDEIDAWLTRTEQLVHDYSIDLRAFEK